MPHSADNTVPPADNTVPPADNIRAPAYHAHTRTRAHACTVHAAKQPLQPCCMLPSHWLFDLRHSKTLRNVTLTTLTRRHHRRHNRCATSHTLQPLRHSRYATDAIPADILATRTHAHAHHVTCIMRIRRRFERYAPGDGC